MPINSFIYIFLGGGFFVGLFISVLLFISSSRHNKSDLFLAVIVFFYSINLVHPHLDLLLSGIWKFNYYRLFEPNQFLILPLFFIYIRNYRSDSFKIKFYDLFHLIPFILVIFISYSEPSRNLENITVFPLMSLFFWIAMMLQAVIYLFYCNRMIKDIHRDLEQNFSNLKGFRLTWLIWLLRFFIIICILYFIPIIFLVHSGNTHLIRAVVSLIVSAAIWIFGIRLVFFVQRRSIPEPVKNYDAQRSISEYDVKIIAEALSVLMEKDKMYTSPELSLDDLVKKTGYSRNDISWYINNRLSKNFYQYINEYRVQEVIRLMQDPKYSHYKIISIAFDAGFNSKPAFNKIFKQITGKTPSEFR